MAPAIELYGLDLSETAIRTAQKALSGIKVDLRTGSIRDTDYHNDFFDVITCNASLSYWEDPIACLDEIYRILKPGGEVKLFEPRKDIDIESALDQIRENMADKSRLRRWGAVQLNRFGLRRGASIGMKLYTLEEFRELARESRFGMNNSIEKTSLLNIPVFALIHLWKPTSAENKTEELEVK
jgi:ubiquinone/menaquinone biosynthesis C-methylase UbiE